jgi:hypothetical protein
MLILFQKQKLKHIKLFLQKKQIENIAYYMKHSKFLSGETLENIRNTFYPHFVTFINIAPLNFLILTLERKNLLHDYGETLYINGTFDISEGKLVLTTIMVKIENIGYPVTWFLSELCTKENYEILFSILKLKMENLLEPLYILCDFEEFLHNSLFIAFLKAVIYRNCFHFMQDNIK